MDCLKELSHFQTLHTHSYILFVFYRYHGVFSLGLDSFDGSVNTFNFNAFQ